MKKTDHTEIKIFKKEYCKDKEARRRMLQDFEVTIEDIEEMIPEKKVISYALDEKYIENCFVIFRVEDKAREKLFYPVFSMEKAMELIELRKMDVPASKTVLCHKDTENEKILNSEICNQGRTGFDNLQLRRLILFVRSLMLLHIDKPKPMKGAMKAVYEKMEKHPNWRVRGSEVKSINTALGGYLSNEVNILNENYTNLQDYIEDISTKTDTESIKSTDFTGLKKILLEEYPEQKIFF